MSVAAPPKPSFRLSRLVLSWYGIAAAFGLLVVLFMLLKSFGAANPVLIKISDSVQLRWFGVVITAAIVVGLMMAQFLAERRGDDPEHIWRLLPIVLIAGLVMARLWFVAFTWDSYKADPLAFGQPNRIGVLEIWRGGLAIQGGVLGGALGLLFYTRRQRLSFWRLADYVAVGLLIGLAIGRWGNFFNNEAYGRETKLSWLGIKIACDSRTTGAIPGTVDLRCPSFSLTGKPGPDVLFHPTFFYESLWCYACFLAVFWLVMKPKTCERRFKVRPRDGDALLLALLTYSIGRLAIESLRVDSLTLNGQPGGLKVAQLVSGLVIIGAGLALFLRHRAPTPDDQSLSVRVIGPKAIRPPDQPKAGEGVELNTDEEEKTVSKRVD